MAYSSSEKEKALPVKIIDQICSYLDAEDLFNLSATNIFWRNAVNRDGIWKPLCVRYFSVNPYGKPLIERKCRVEPPFETVTNSSQNLSDICEWRIRFAQEIYVLNNWKLRRFHTEDIPDDKLRLLFQKSYFIYGNYAIIHNCTKNVIEIWKLTDDGFSQMEPIVFHNNRYYYLHPLRNGFVTISSPFIYYYVHDEDGFQLKIRTLVTKALHPEIPLLADLSEIDPSHVEEFKDNPRFLRSAVNERYFVVFDRKDEYILFIIWDLQNFTTFSCELNHSIKNRSPSIFLVEGESSILFMYFGNLEIVGSTIYILKIQNSRIEILNVHNTMIRDDPSTKMVGDSLAMMYYREIVFLAKDGTTRSVRCFEVEDLINCRSFYVGLQMRRKPQKVVSIDKKTLSVQVIREGFCVDVKSHLKRSSLDLVLFSYFDREPVEPFCDCDQEFNDACNEALNADNNEKRELYDLRKSNIISWSNKEYFDALNPECISNSNKIVIAFENIFHFW